MHAPARTLSPAEGFDEILGAAMRRGRIAAKDGVVSAQIPALADVPADKFAMAMTTVDGIEAHIGDSSERFSLQSISKLFALCAVLRFDHEIWPDIGWGPTDAAYGSVADLERNAGRPRNPFVNPGALVVTDRLLQFTGNAVAATAKVIEYEKVHGSVGCDPLVAASEALTDHRNSAIAHVLAEHQLLRNGIDDVLAQYFQQCAITASVRTLSRAALFLADHSGRRRCLDQTSIRRINAVLMTAGMYGAAGDIAYRIGLPAKSGIGGGILAVMPGRGTVCVWSPPLDSNGNSAGGIAAIEEFAHLANWSVF